MASGGRLLDRFGVLFAGGMAVVVAWSALILDRASAARASVVVDLDASRRWVTLSDVHPAFVAACRGASERAACASAPDSPTTGPPRLEG